MGYAQEVLSPDFISLDYIAALPGESLKTYARRFLQSLVENGTWDPKKEIVLIGISFGGAIAQEIASQTKVKSLILLGSLRSGRELRLGIHFFAKYLSQLIPIWVYDTSIQFLEPVMGKVSGLSHKDVVLCQVMYDDVSKEFFRAALKMLAEWPGVECTVLTLRIHGEDDHIIPLHKTSGVDVVVKDAKHLVGLAQREIVNDAINKFLNQTSH